VVVYPKNTQCLAKSGCDSNNTKYLKKWLLSK